ncbi:MAG: hypothetical protein CSYNP_00775 [Syntrophus sp. SKADARSKE-3]|nr:hypothetical protein [Syntrophus sp. SKADARSKE-3]
MPVTIDARGLACPQPVILAKKAIEDNQAMTILVDNDAAVENIRRLAVKMACTVSVTDRGNGIREIFLARTAASEEHQMDAEAFAEELACSTEKATGALVVVLSDNRMGRGDDTLGDVLIRSFIHTLLQLKPLPDTIICYNAGVKLATGDSTVLDDLQSLEKAGTEILVCGTCINYFSLGDQIAVGHISNMYDIVETMAGAARLLRP